MCDCNIIKLIKGTKKLQLTDKNNKFDYIYLKCDICKKYQDFDGTNYLSCNDCDKFYCSDCKKMKKEYVIYIMFAIVMMMIIKNFINVIIIVIIVVINVFKKNVGNVLKN